MTVIVTEDDFDLADIYAKLRTPSTLPTPGAVTIFVGLVREMNNDCPITAMTLEHYPGMTEKQLEAIRDEAMQRWPLTGAMIVHRIGRLSPNDQIVAVGTASAHRQASFDASNFIMDYLKTNAPFWKSEDTVDGARWVAPRAADDKAKRRW
jgi:molybdopterin synthase catalytic subunit